MRGAQYLLRVMMRRTRTEHIWSGLASAPDVLRHRSEPTLRAKGGHAPQKPSRSLLASSAAMSGAISRSNPLGLALYSAARVQRVKEQQRVGPASLLIGDLGLFSRRCVVIAPKFLSSNTEVFDVHAPSVRLGPGTQT
jgi:hypothetical protein